MDTFLPVVFNTMRGVGSKLMQQSIKGFTLESLYRLAQVCVCCQVRFPDRLHPPCTRFVVFCF